MPKRIEIRLSVLGARVNEAKTSHLRGLPLVKCLWRVELVRGCI